jgi:cytochrome c oxidase subunit 4
MNHPVVPIKVYVGIFLALIALTVTTVAVSKLELGEYNFVAAIAIAMIKALLVVLFFMHVKQASAMTKLFVVAGFFWMAILFVFTLSDYFSRNWLPRGKWW